MTDTKNENEATLSPTGEVAPRNEEGQVLMKFSEAMEVVLKGEKVTKLEWKDEKWWGQLHDKKLYLHKPDGTLAPWTLSDGDLAGDDYVIIN